MTTDSTRAGGDAGLGAVIYPRHNFGEQSRPTPATRLVICDRCREAEWHVPVVGGVIVHSRCAGRMRDAGPDELALARQALARGRLIRIGARVSFAPDQEAEPELAALGDRLDGTVTGYHESRGAFCVRLDLASDREAWIAPDRLTVQLTRAALRSPSRAVR